jgi:hypothetical protein
VPTTLPSTFPSHFGPLTDLPEWLGAAVIGAVIAAVGFMLKQVADFVLGLLRTRERRRARLVDLASLLQASQAAFLTQIDLSRRLYAQLGAGGAPGERPVGRDRLFASRYATMTDEQRELHRLIRGITQHALRPVNLALSEWLKADTTFKVMPRFGRRRRELARMLRQLEAHLIVWIAKYEVWIPVDPKYALVYLADEQRHGVAFPPNLDPLVRELVDRAKPPPAPPAVSAAP